MTTEQSRAELFLKQELGIDNPMSARKWLQNMKVALVLADDVAGERLGQIALLTSADILCRLGTYCPNIAVHAPDGLRVGAGVPLLARGAPLVDELLQFMTDVQDPLELPCRTYDRVKDGDTYDIMLVFGALSAAQASYGNESQVAAAIGQEEYIQDEHFRAQGERGDVPLLTSRIIQGIGEVSARHIINGWYERWTGGFSLEEALLPITYRGANPFGALLAGALGATAVSRLLLGAVSDPASTPEKLPPLVSFSALSYSEPEQPELEPDLEELVDLRPLEPLLMVGGGAVASAVALALAAVLRIEGALDIADADHIDASNLERHLISRWSDIGVPKVSRTASLFTPGGAVGGANGLQVRYHLLWYEELPAQQWRTIIAAVDSADARRRLQFALPQVLINAGTVGSEFLVSRHDYTEGPCLECLYPERQAPARTQVDLLSAQTGLEPEEVLVLQATGTPLTDAQVARIIQHGHLLFALEDLERSQREGFHVLVQAACTTAQVRPGLPAATIGFVAALPGILLAAELVKDSTIRAGLSPQPSVGARVDRADRKKEEDAGTNMNIVRSTSTYPPLWANRNAFWLDTFGDLEPLLEESRPSRGCRCQSEAMRSAYRYHWGDV
jgi:molybdopterin/thiamine biosynthesis adenylyltransferase